MCVWIYTDIFDHNQRIDRSWQILNLSPEYAQKIWDQIGAGYFYCLFKLERSLSQSSECNCIRFAFHSLFSIHNSEKITLTPFLPLQCDWDIKKHRESTYMTGPRCNEINLDMCTQQLLSPCIPLVWLELQLTRYFFNISSFQCFFKQTVNISASLENICRVVCLIGLGSFHKLVLMSFTYLMFTSN